MKNRYNSFEEYCNYLRPLLLLEIWNTLTKESECDEKKYKYVLHNFFLNFTLQFSFVSESLRKFSSVDANDCGMLICIRMKLKSSVCSYANDLV